MMNKKAGGEGISWAIGLVAIVLIMIAAIIVFNMAKFGEKKPITVSSANNIYSLELQRIGVYVVSSDFNSNERGKILYDFHFYLTEAFGTVVNYPTLFYPKMPENYIPFMYTRPQSTNFAEGFYLSCSKCPQKYMEIGYRLVVKNGI